MMRSRIFALAIALVTLAAASAAWGCSVAGPNTHIGTVKAVDIAQSTLTVKDAETGEDLTFVADTPEMLKGIAPRDRVTVVFTEQGKTLRATSITKG